MISELNYGKCIRRIVIVLLIFQYQRPIICHECYKDIYFIHGRTCTVVNKQDKASSSERKRRNKLRHGAVVLVYVVKFHVDFNMLTSKFISKYRVKLSFFLFFILINDLCVFIKNR